MSSRIEPAPSRGLTLHPDASAAAWAGFAETLDLLGLELESMEARARRIRRQVRATAFHEAGHAVAYLHRRIFFKWVAVRPLLAGQEWLEFQMDEDSFGVVHSGQRIYLHYLNRIGVTPRNGQNCTLRFAVSK